ncbi:MAG TPA: T9SS type A sorting domain-containing protein, partial [Saprospiraceae bacterium]|nr:T9SS type A sorting domain-containing protein [Saprospiraceae bacterium]HPI08958.1 T9SS type A sorting domain-containing protein [Saprospiraceae bacterium]
PNPTSGPLLLTSRHLDKYKTGLTYQLTDNTGKLLRTEKITGEKTNFDLSNEPAGAYYLNILTDREQVVQFPIVVTNR